MDVFLFPSETDTFGNVVQEVLASGVPVVVSDRDGPKSPVQDAVTGFVTTSPKGFIDAVQMLIGDDRLRMTMGAAGRAYALKTSWDDVFEQVYRAYPLAKRRQCDSVANLLLSTGKRSFRLPAS